MMPQTLLSVLLQHRGDSMVESIALGLISAVTILLFSLISKGVSKSRAKKKDAEKMQ